MNPVVSIIVPTKNRAWLHAGLLSVFNQQDYPHIELLIADSGESGPSTVFQNNQQDNVKYYWSDTDISVGAKRNFLIERAVGDVIVHFDDDDFYAPHYVSTMVRLLQEYDFVTLSAWYNRDVRTGDFYYWDTTAHSDYLFTPGLSTTVTTQVAMNLRSSAANTWGYGFCYAYKRALWERHRFPDINLKEDIIFVEAFKNTAAMHCFADQSCLVVHSLWAHTLSSCTPQYRLPSFLLNQLSEDAARYYQVFHQHPLSDAFVFFKNVDSEGGDIGYVGRLSANTLLDCCLKHEGIAINANGWIKETLKPQEQWMRLPANSSGGMWVRKTAVDALGLVQK